MLKPLAPLFLDHVCVVLCYGKKISTIFVDKFLTTFDHLFYIDHLPMHSSENFYSFLKLLLSTLCVVCVCVCVRACVHACVCVCVCSKGMHE